MPTPDSPLFVDVARIEGALSTLGRDLPTALNGLSAIVAPDVAHGGGTEALAALAAVVGALPAALALNAGRMKSEVDSAVARAVLADGGPR